MIRGIKGKCWTLATILVSALLLALAFRKVDFDQLMSTLANAKLLPIFLVAIINFGLIALKSYRWQVIIRSARPVSFASVFLATLVGFMSSTFLPAKGGELVRILILGKRENISRTTVLGTLLLDQVLEGAGMFPLLLLLVLQGGMPDWLRTGSFVLLLALVMLFGLMVLLMRVKTETWSDPQRLAPKWKIITANFISKVRDGIQSLGKLRIVAWVLLLSIASWLVQVFFVYLCFQAVGLDLGLHAAIFVLMAIALAMMIPSAPSSFGTFEFAAVLALGSLGVESASALSFALIYHLVQLIPTTVAGILALPALGTRFGDLWGRQKKATMEGCAKTCRLSEDQIP